MDAELKAKWVKALRSGEYEQAKNVLFDGRNHCCLGVLCAVEGQPYHGNGGYNYVEAIVGENAAMHLMHMNDVKGNTFPEIADYIEANL